MFSKYLIHLQITESVSLLNCCVEVSGQRKNMSSWLMTFGNFWEKYKTNTRLTSCTASVSYQRLEFSQLKKTITG